MFLTLHNSMLRSTDFPNCHLFNNFRTIGGDFTVSHFRPPPPNTLPIVA